MHAFFGSLRGQIVWRTVLLIGCATLTGLSASYEHGRIATCVLLVVTGLGSAALWRAVDRHNRELARFFSTLRCEDLTPSFDLGHLGPDFAALGRAFADVVAAVRQQRRSHEEQRRYLAVLLEHSPVAMLAVHPSGQVDLLNLAGRRLLGGSNLAGHTNLAQMPSELAKVLPILPVGEPRTVEYTANNGAKAALCLHATVVTYAHTAQRLISAQNIDKVLERAQIDAWQQMARVLAHEMINSLTPITSLCGTSVELLTAIDQASTAASRAEAAADLQQALNTMARRGSSLMDFVAKYRQVTDLPRPSPVWFDLHPLFDELALLHRAHWRAANLALHTQLEPQHLRLFADRSQIEQALINLLKNAAEATKSPIDSRGSGPSQVILKGDLAPDGAVRLRVIDGGPGLTLSQLDHLFVPFFTTKADGSGIGLGIVRQTMVAHGGQAVAYNHPNGGACFELRFPASPTDGDHALALPRRS